jgi:hypothetical protein
MKKTWFFGWTNTKWFFREISNLYSGKPSYFSKKRIESGVAFVVGQWGMIYFLIKNIDTVSGSDIVLWAGVEFAIAGYMVNAIQKEKQINSKTPKEFLEDEYLDEEESSL